MKPILIPASSLSSNKIILKSGLSMGDIVTLTAAVRDLKIAYGNKYLIDVRTSCGGIWENNPHLTPLDEQDPLVRVIDMEYPLIHKSNTAPYHFIHGYRMFLEDALGIKIPATDFKGDIHISSLEKSWINQVEENFGYKGKFWIINSGGKNDFTAKWINPDTCQVVVNHFKDRVKFVQIGESGDNHFHIPLRNTFNLIGKTDMRQLIRLVYHSSGVLCPVTGVMHLAAAIETKHCPPKNRPCIVWAGGREPSSWEAYPHHQYLHTNGALNCCDNGGCWKSRCTIIGDGDEKDKNTCIYPTNPNSVLFSNSVYKNKFKLMEPKCLKMITPELIIKHMELLLEKS